MRASRLGAAATALAAGLALSACETYGDGYGYSEVAVGYGYPNAYVEPYYDPAWGYYAANPYWGWYGGYYYPGTGIYIYDRHRRPRVWNDRYRRYWSDRQGYWRGRPDWRGREFRDNWGDFRGDRIRVRPVPDGPYLQGRGGTSRRRGGKN